MSWGAWEKECKVPETPITTQIPRMPIKSEDINTETGGVSTTRGCSPASLAPILGNSCSLPTLSASLLIYPSSLWGQPGRQPSIPTATWAILEPGFSGWTPGGGASRGLIIPAPMPPQPRHWQFGNSTRGTRTICQAAGGRELWFITRSPWDGSHSALLSRGGAGPSSQWMCTLSEPQLLCRWLQFHRGNILEPC